MGSDIISVLDSLIDGLREVARKKERKKLSLSLFSQSKLFLTSPAFTHNIVLPLPLIILTLSKILLILILPRDENYESK